MKSLLPYYGGKAGRVGAWIAQQLPPHRCYVEAFGGMAGVLMQKSPSEVEVYNDVEQSLVNLFHVVRTPELCQQLYRLLRWTPYSRVMHREAFTSRTEVGLSEVEHAHRTYVTLAMDFKGSLGYPSFGFGGPKGRSNEARAFVSSIERLHGVGERLRHVQLDCRPALDVCRRWDHPDTLLYLDPPYTADSRNGAWVYSHELKQADHEELLTWMQTAKSKIILSGYDNSLYYEQLELNGWIRRAASTSTRVGNSRTGEKAKRVEVIWLNKRAAAASLSLFCEAGEEATV